jgi:hypothetical protein
MPFHRLNPSCKVGFMSQYIFDSSVIDTSPGNPLSPFSPPHGWDGEVRSYRDWLRHKFTADPNVRQRLGIAVRSFNLNRPLTISGDFQSELLEIIKSYDQKGH